MAKSNYDASSIKQLPFPKNVQQRPGMYIGPADSSGMLTCVREILNNSVDEFLAGFCSKIIVERVDDLTFRIIDNGRGVPFDKHDSGKNALEVIFGELHAGRNFTTKTVYSTGINGVGGSCVNALSTEFVVSSLRGKESGSITFNNGIKKAITLNKLKPRKEKGFEKSSTCVEFTFNPEYFEDNSSVIEDDLFKLVSETAFLNSGLEIIFKVDGQKDTKFNYTNGVVEMLKAYSPNPIIPVIEFPAAVINDTKVEIAFTYTNTFRGESITSFCNTINTSEGGTHVTGFKRAISQKLLAYIKENNLTKEKVDNEDIFEGLDAIVSVFVFNPKYTSQTKTKLANTEVNGHTLSYMNSALNEWLNTNPKEMKVIAKKIELAAKARIAQKRALDAVKKDTGSTLTSLSNIAKFSDCEEQMSGRTELFLVEGEHIALVKLL